MSRKKEIADFFANPNWCIDSSTPDYISDHFNKTWGCESPSKPDLTPVTWNGMIVGTRQDLIEGRIDPTDRDAWKP